ncbi:MAG: hypothetical protein INF75_09570 [Roseomonas sp.]|nr:hypothetical protein [Roseomonas sp.]MCA3332238.1 hypothetical protein [Roseomonas sp.]MCA3335469.1 hypothetical protein [Roseomonas sp.]MCA3353566.1 hypothetical protein [Roseomonas sp.]MCA3386354.1 hypothetical protein [Roseomonas sp.]
MTKCHAWRMPGRKHAAAAFASFWLCLAALPAFAQFSDMGALTQRGVPAEATAENGVVAQERAFAAGRRTAWDRIQGMINTTRRPSDAELDRMVRSIVIEQETTGPQRYSGRLTIQFDAEAVQSFVEGSEIRAATLQSGTAPEAPISITPAAPIMVTLDAVARYGSLNEWLEIRRRLAIAGARLDVVGITTDRARVQLGLRVPVGMATETFAQNGLRLARGTGAPNDQWRLGLAGRS